MRTHDLDALSTREGRRSEALWALALVLVAAALRLPTLGHWSFWADEVFTVRDALAFPRSLTVNPLPYAAIASFLGIFGKSEWSARFAPALVGIASVPLVQWVGRRWFGSRAGRMAALMVALSPWHLFWSQNARHYAFTFFFALLAAGALFRALEEGRHRWTLTAIAATVGLVLSHTLAGALLIGFGGYVILVGWLHGRRERPAGWRAASTLYFAPFVLGGLVVLLVPTLRAYLFSGWGRNLWARNPLYVLMTFAYGVSLPVLGAAAFGLFPVRDEEESHARARLFLWSSGGFPFAFFLVASLFQNVAGYYLFFLTPFVFLIAGDVCARVMDRRSDVLRWVPIVVIAAALVAGDVTYFALEHGGRPDWRAAMRRLAPDIEDGDRIVMPLPEVGQYYLPDAPARWDKLTLAHLADPDSLLAPSGGDTFVVVDMKSYQALDAGGDFRRWLDAHAHRVIRVPGYARGSDRTIEVFRLDAPNAASMRGTRNPLRSSP